MSEEQEWFWLVDLEQRLEMEWSELCRTMLPWCWTLSLVQEMTVVLSEQFQCETENLGEQLSQVVAVVRQLGEQLW